MSLTKEQADKIEVKRDTEVGDLYSYEGAHHKICAEYLAKWAYRRLETWPAFLEACEAYERHMELHDNSEHPKANMFCTECPRYRKGIKAAIAKAKQVGE